MDTPFNNNILGLFLLFPAGPLARRGDERHWHFGTLGNDTSWFNSGQSGVLFDWHDVSTILAL